VILLILVYTWLRRLVRAPAFRAIVLHARGRARLRLRWPSPPAPSSNGRTTPRCCYAALLSKLLLALGFALA
jgi:hypothetical protein